MIRYNEKPVELDHFPDGTLLMKETVTETEEAVVRWNFEHNEEMVALYFLAKHLRAKGVKRMVLELPYIPNARQDRVKKPEDVFTLKYFAELINELKFQKVTVLDPHSYVSEALFEHLEIQTPKKYVEKVIQRIGKDKLMLFFPDFEHDCQFGKGRIRQRYWCDKKRDWTTGEIKGLKVTGQTEELAGSVVLIVDDICSKGGTFYHSAKALRELGAKDVYLYVSHCENSIFEGELLK